MSGDVFVCQVCLRTDRKLEYVEIRLLLFHAELVGFPELSLRASSHSRPSMFTIFDRIITYQQINCQDRRFCFECEHLLRRFYNFRNKCRKGQDLLTDWHKSMIKLPLDVMSTLLPSSLDKWTLNSVITYNESMPTPPCLDIDLQLDTVIIQKRNPKVKRSKVHNSGEVTEESKRKVIMPILVPMSQFNNESVLSTEMGNIQPAADTVFISPELHTSTVNVIKRQQSVETEHDLEYFTDYEPNNTDNEDNKDSVSKTENGQGKAHLDIEYIEMACINSDDLGTLYKVKNDSDDINKLDVDIKEDITENDTYVSDVANVSNEEKELFNNEIMKMQEYQYNNKDTTSVLDDIDNKDVINDDSDNDSATDENYDSEDDPHIIKINTITANLRDFGENINGMFNDFEKIIPDLSMVTLKKTSMPIPVQVRSIKKSIDFVLNCNQNALKVMMNTKNMSIKEYVTYVMMTTIDKLDGSTRGGTGVDKEFVRQCLEDKVPPSLRQQLLRIINTKSGNSVKYSLLIKAREIEKRYKDINWKKVSEVFHIEHLNSEDKVLEEFENRKNYEIYTRTKMKCNMCYVGFRSKNMLDMHIKDFHDKTIGNYSCELCKTYYKNQSKMTDHNKRHHEVVFKCSKCNMVAHSLTIAEKHYNYHKGIKIQCELCTKEFNWPGIYYHHLEEIHGCNFVCTFCALTFPTEKKLEEHKSKHIKTKKAKSDGSSGVKCEHCGLIFISQKVCDRHIKIKHTEKPWFGPREHLPRNKVIEESDKIREQATRAYECDHCGRIYTHKKQIVQHIIMAHKNIRKHLPRRPIQCRVCNFNTTCAFYLSNHFKAAHPDLHMDTVYADKRKYMCDHCGNRYATSRELNIHINKNHSDETPFACDVCPKKLKTEVQLLRHKWLHMPKSQECKVCGKLFRSPSNLFLHMRTHIQNRKFKCETCGKGFLHSSALKEHIRGVHFNIRRVKKTKPKIDKAKTDSNDASNKTRKTSANEENDITDTTQREHVFSDPQNAVIEANNVLFDSEIDLITTFNIDFTQSGKVAETENASENLVLDTGSKVMLSKRSKRVLPKRTSKNNAKSAKRRRKLSTDTDDSD